MLPKDKYARQHFLFSSQIMLWQIFMLASKKTEGAWKGGHLKTKGKLNMKTNELLTRKCLLSRVSQKVTKTNGWFQVGVSVDNNISLYFPHVHIECIFSKPLFGVIIPKTELSKSWIKENNCVCGITCFVQNGDTVASHIIAAPWIKARNLILD